MFRHLAFLMTLTFASIALAAEHQARLVTYTGRIAPLRVSDKKAVSKGFHVTWFVPSASGDGKEQPTALFLVEENLHALPWYLRAGLTPPDGPAVPRIGYQLDDRPRVVELPPLVIANLPTESSDNLSNVVSEATIDGRRCQVFEGELPSGRHARLAVDAVTTQLIEYRAEVVMGRGDRFQLSLELDEETALSKNAAARIAALAGRLQTVLPKAAEVSQPFGYQLPAAVIAKIGNDRENWLAAARQTPYRDFVEDLLRDVENRRMSRKSIGDLARKMIGSPAPKLPTTRLDGTPLNSAALDDQVVVLHFWNYDIEPLSKPFGQVGPLDFLARKYGEDGVEVLGIVVDPGFAKPATSGPPLRSAKRFAEFMNLDYALCRDSGALLEEYGDPLSHGGELPVWVVIDAEGRVRFYNTGLFHVEDPNKGLQELEKVIEEFE